MVVMVASAEDASIYLFIHSFRSLYFAVFPGPVVKNSSFRCKEGKERVFHPGSVAKKINEN